MSFAVFFQKKFRQAVHWGSMSHPSLSCVHAGFDTARQLNYHSRADHTIVVVDYDAAALEALCCARFGGPGRNPCHKIKKGTCPGGHS